MSTYRKTKQGFLFDIRVIPNSKTNSLSLMSDQTLKIKLTACPVNLEANKQLMAVLAHFFQCDDSQIMIKSGLQSQNKKILIQDLSELELDNHLNRL